MGYAGLFQVSFMFRFVRSPFCATVANLMMCRVSDLALPAMETLDFGEPSPRNTDSFMKGTGSAVSAAKLARTSWDVGG